MQFQKLAFENPEGKKLAARLDLPLDEKPVAYAIFAHCFGCTKNLNAVVNISRAMTRNAIAVLRFDFTGLGESEGDFAETTFSSNVADLIAAAAFLESNYEGPKILVGHSLGGAAVLRAAPEIPSVLAVVTIGAPATPSTPDRSAAFIQDLEQLRMEETIRGLGKPLLIFHAPGDAIVGIRNAAEIFRAAKHPKSFVSLDGADHLLSNRNDSQYVGSVLAAWAGRYIGAAPSPPPERNLQDNRVVVRTGKKGYRTDIMVDDHNFLADEPVALGGSNTGPTPYDYLLAALGACTSITLRMFADRKGWPLDAVAVRLNHRKIHASDCASCETKEGQIDHIDRELELIGPLDDEQRKRLVAIADKCPVHHTLQSEIIVETRLKD